MTVICDVKKTREANFHMKDRGKIHLFLGLSIKREEGKVTVNQERFKEALHERFGSMQTLKNYSQFDFETPDSTERRRRCGSKDLQSLGWITSISDQAE